MIFDNGGILLGVLGRTSWSKWWQETGCQPDQMCEGVVSPVGGEGFEVGEAISAEIRANEFAGTLSKIQRERYVTTAVTETAQGVRVVSSSEGKLRTAMRAM